jgi:membrane protease YdiL (CAAX protease family)
VNSSENSERISTFGDRVDNLHDQTYVGYGPWSAVAWAILVWLASFLLVVILQLMVLFPYVFKQGITPGTPDFPRALAEFASTDKTAIVLQILAVVPAHLLTILLVWLVVTRIRKFPFWKTMDWRWESGRMFFLYVGMGVALFALGSVVAKLLGGDVPTALEQIINSSRTARYTVAVVAVATAPLAEELVYRGVLYSALERAIGTIGAVVLVLLLFTMVHIPQYWPNYGVIAAIGILSVALTIIRAYTRNLFPCVIIHLVFNGIQALYLVSPYFK